MAGLFRSQAVLHLKILALRQQLAMVAHKDRKLRFGRRERLFWVWFYRFWHGFLETLAVFKADFDRVAAIVNTLPQVAHNYRRDHKLNMWFVLAAPGVEELRETIARVRSLTGLALCDFPKLREFHLGFWLQLEEDGEPGLRRVERPPAGASGNRDAVDLAIVTAT